MNLKVIALISLLLSPAMSWAATGFDTLNVFPNPVRVRDGHTTVTFDNVPVGTTLQIYNVRGRLVFENATASTTTTITWDLTNRAGKNVASGIYFYILANSAGEKQTGKFALIR